MEMIKIPTVVGVALEVIGDKYGVGKARIDALTKAGYDADVVQQCVNELLPIIRKYGD